MGPVGVGLRLRFVLAFVGGNYPLSGLVVAVVALVAQRDQPGLFEGGEDVPDASGGGVVRVSALMKFGSGTGTVK
jgi:hypothetical protein